MHFKRYLLPGIALLLSLGALAQAPTQSQIDQFMALPKAQQEALARQYGIDIEQLTGQRSTARQRVENVRVVTPLGQAGAGDGAPGIFARDVNDEAETRQTDDVTADARLKPFGYELFAGSPSTFAPVTEIPLPSTYILGPGDVVRIQMWGKENQLLELPVSRDGTIDFPQSGPQPVAGLSFEDVREQLTKLVAEQYIGVQVSVSLGELRSMRVFILGEARHPGAYTVSSLSTITNALFVSGGVKPSGSLRKVQHKRAGKLLGQLDLYDLLLQGDTSADSRLQPGDVIFIPPVGPRVAIDGEVYRPALYELKGPTTAQQLVDIAGGLTPQAYPKLVRIERTNSEFLRVMAEADLSTSSGKAVQLRSGDLVKVASVAEITGQFITVQGAVVRPGHYAWVPGMRVSALFSSLEADLLPVADKHYAAVVRTDLLTDRVSVITVRLREALDARGGPADIPLAERDTLMVFSDDGKPASEALSQDYSRATLFAPVLQRLKAQARPDAPQQTIHVTGPVRYPGEYPLPESRQLQDAIVVAGGLKDSASLFVAELARHETIDGRSQTRIIELDMADVMDGHSRFTLHSRDRLLIKPIPEFAKTRTVTLRGEVMYPGDYTFRDGDTLRDVIARAGGLTGNAFPQGAVFTREKLRQLEAQRLREAEERLQSDLLGVQLEADKAVRNTRDMGQLEELLKEVQASRPVGRMVIDLAAVLSDEHYQSLRLQDGDVLTVPDIPQAVSVFGEVQFPTSHLHEPGLTVADYLERSGGPTAQADPNRVYVVRADGSVLLPKKSRWFSGRSQQVGPGDTIIMPIDVDRLNQMELWTNVSQIVYQMALGAAAINSF